MKESIGWSYRPYKPLMFDTGDIYICRIAPGEREITFEWLDQGGGEKYTVMYKKREDKEFLAAGESEKCEYTLFGLSENTDYEFYVFSGDKKSRIRLARTGKTAGTPVNYLHPEDRAYSFSGNYLCSPSLVRHPDGYLLSSMDVFGHSAPQNLTLIFRSDDEGKSWHYVSELMPAFWTKLFIHKGEVYALSASTEYGDLLIGKSSDGGKNFCAPTVLLRGSGRSDTEGVHKNPQNILRYNGRIYETLEWGAWRKGYHAVMVMSCDENDDLLSAKSWHITPPVKYSPEWEGTAKGQSTGNIEGTLAVSPGGRIYNIMRYDTTKTEPNYGIVLAYEVNKADPDAPLEYSHAINFPANLSKFMIKYDEKSKRYLSLANRITDKNNISARNLLSLMVSEDLEEWKTAADIIDMRDKDPAFVGYQYVDFEIEGEDIIFLSRTADNNAASFHDTNYQTFHRIKDFRKLIKE